MVPKLTKIKHKKSKKIFYSIRSDFLEFVTAKFNIYSIFIRFVLTKKYIYIYAIYFQAVAMFILLYGFTIWTLTRLSEKKARWEQYKNATSYFEQILEAAPHKTIDVRPFTSNLKNYPSKMNKMCGTLLEKQG